MWDANAHAVFHGSEPIRLLKLGDYYQIDSNGRHRIAAAQAYYLQTGIAVDLPVDVFEKKQKMSFQSDKANLKVPLMLLNSNQH